MIYSNSFNGGMCLDCILKNCNNLVLGIKDFFGEVKCYDLNAKLVMELVACLPDHCIGDICEEHLVSFGPVEGFDDLVEAVRGIFH
jgi:hypothetical protein